MSALAPLGLVEVGAEIGAELENFTYFYISFDLINPICYCNFNLFTKIFILVKNFNFSPFMPFRGLTSFECKLSNVHYYSSSTICT